MKIYLQKPWKTSDSPYYKFLRANPPNGIEFINLDEFDLIQNPKKMRLMHKLKAKIKSLIKMLYPSMPNVHFTNTPEKYDLIHCAHCLSKNKTPWVCDIEYVGSLWAAGFSEKYPSRKKVLKYLNSPYCKKILAWTEWTKKGIVKEFPEVKNKVEVLYPGIPFIESNKKIRKEKNKIKLLFVSRRFYFKGGLYAVELMDKLTKKYKNVEATLVSEVPEEVLERYEKNKKIKFLCMVPQKKLFEEIYPSHDILVYPSFTDTFGFPIIEAMNFGLPVVSVDGQSRREIIEDGKTGFVTFNSLLDKRLSLDDLKKIERKSFDDLLINIEKLILNFQLRKVMSKESIKVIKDGKFSVIKRNNKLKKYYLEAINGK